MHRIITCFASSILNTTISIIMSIIDLSMKKLLLYCCIVFSVVLIGFYVNLSPAPNENTPYYVDQKYAIIQYCRQYKLLLLPGRLYIVIYYSCRVIDAMHMKIHIALITLDTTRYDTTLLARRPNLRKVMLIL